VSPARADALETQAAVHPRPRAAPPAGGAAPPASGESRAWRRWLALLVVLALVARVIGLNGGLWIDEIYSLVRSFRAPLIGILTEFWGDNHHPLYALLAHTSRAALGESAWTVRLPALLFGVAAIPMLFAVARVVASTREALLAAALLAVSYHHVWFSQNARGYSAIAFFALVTTWSLLRGIGRPRLSYAALYATAAALGAYTHLTMVLVVVGHAVAVAVHLAMTAGARGGDDVVSAAGTPVPAAARLRWALLAFGLSAALTLVLYAPMLDEVLHFFLRRPSQLRGVSTPRWAMVETVRVLVLGLGAGLAVVGGLVVAAGGVVGLAGLASFWKRSRLFVLLLVCAALATVAGAALARGTMYPRFFFFAIGPAILIAVRGAFASCEWIAARVGRTRAGDPIALAGIGMVGALSAASLLFNYRYPKQDFEGAMRYVLAERQAGEAVVSAGLAADPYRMLYGQDWPNLSTVAEIDSVRAAHDRTWVLWTFPRYLERHAPGVDKLLHDECPEPRVFRGTVGGGDVLVCALPHREASGTRVRATDASSSIPDPARPQ